MCRLHLHFLQLWHNIINYFYLQHTVKCVVFILFFWNYLNEYLLSAYFLYISLNSTHIKSLAQSHITTQPNLAFFLNVGQIFYSFKPTWCLHFIQQNQKYFNLQIQQNQIIKCPYKSWQNQTKHLISEPNKTEELKTHRSHHGWLQLYVHHLKEAKTFNIYWPPCQNNMNKFRINDISSQILCSNKVRRALNWVCFSDVNSQSELT